MISENIAGSKDLTGKVWPPRRFRLRSFQRSRIHSTLLTLKRFAKKMNEKFQKKPLDGMPNFKILFNHFNNGFLLTKTIFSSNSPEKYGLLVPIFSSYLVMFIYF